MSDNYCHMEYDNPSVINLGIFVYSENITVVIIFLEAMSLNSETTLGCSRFLHHICELTTDEVARIRTTLQIQET